LVGGKQIRADIGRLVAGFEPADRRSMLLWGAGAGLAVVVWAVASAFAAAPGIDPIHLASIPDSGAPAELGRSAMSKLEARNAQLLRAIVTLSDDNDTMRNRVAELEKRLQTLSEIPALDGRLTRMEGEVAHIASTMPFARTTRTATVTAALTDPAPLMPVPAPLQAPPAPQAAAVAVAPPATSPPVVASATPALPAPQTRTAAAPVADVAAEAEIAATEPQEPALDLDPVETASIDPDEIIGEGDAMDPSELREMEVALAEPTPPVVPKVAVPLPKSRPPQVATRTVFGVNLGKFESVAKVKSRWNALAKKDPALVKPLKPMVAARDGADGRETYLVAGPFTDAGAAAVACAKFKAIGATCRTTNYSAD
jgi:hypothetical protein